MGTRRNGFGFDAWADCCGPGFVFSRRGERSRRRSRVFDRGDLKYMILRLLGDRPMHGYEVMRALEEGSGGCYTASPGSVYPTLQMLEDQGYVASAEEEGKRVYRITDAGRAFLEEHSDRVDDIVDRVEALGERFSGSEFRELTRSFVQLAQASWENAVRGKGDPDAVARIREILERAREEVVESRRPGRQG